MAALPVCEEIMSLSVAVWPQCTDVTDRRQPTGLWHTDSLACPSHESAKRGTQSVFLHRFDQFTQQQARALHRYGAVGCNLHRLATVHPGRKRR